MLPRKEPERLEALRRYRILDTPPDGAFDHITAVAATLFQVPIAIVSLVDHDRIWFKSHHGLDICEISREPGLCASAIFSSEVYHIRDAIHDVRALANPLVAGDFGLRFYAAAPLRTHDGFNLGTLCIIDRKPRELAPSEAELLTKLAALVMDQMELRLAARKIADLEQVQRTISEQLRQTNQALGETIEDLKLQIAAREKAEAAVRELATGLEAKFRRLVDSNIIGIYIWDLDSQIIDANEAFLHIVGYGRADLVSGSMRWTDLTPTEWRDRDEQAHAELKATGAIQPFEKEYFRKDGSRVPVLLGCAIFEGSENEGVAFVLDLSKRKRAEEALRRSEAYLTEAERLSHTGSFGWNVSSGKIYWSQETFRIFEYDPPTEPTSELLLQRIHPEDRALVREVTDRALNERKDFDLEHRLLMPDGSVKYLRVVGHPSKEESGSFEFVGAVTDITERKRSEEALQKAQAELAHVTRVATLGELTASIAHEINQPLAAVVNNASACVRWLAAQNLEEARQSASLVIAEGHRAGEIISRIRALAKKAPPQKDWLDLNQTIGEVIAMARSAMQRNRVSLQTQLANDLPVILGDRIQLQQVILNLLINAVEAMAAVDEGPRELWVCSQIATEIPGESTEERYEDRALAEAKRTHALITVRDSGPGLVPQRLNRLFDAFYTTKPQGLGMGLAISRSIIEAHGGRLWAMANAPRGAVFQFTLPIRDEEHK